MGITYQHYMDNPAGKGAAIFVNREVYRDIYTKRFDAILLRENGHFENALYYNKKDDTYVIHMKVPSEVVLKFYYDVIVEFYPLDITNKTELDIKRYGVRFFSNDPSFVYTYAYVFKNNDMFIKELEPKMSKRALKEKPDERNPYQIPSYVKSLYFCFLYMQTRSLFNKIHWKNHAQNLSWRNILHDVEHADKKIAERQEKGVEASKIKKEVDIEDAKESLRTGKKLVRHYGMEDNNSSSGRVNVIKPIKPKSKGATVTKHRGNIHIIKKK